MASDPVFAALMTKVARNPLWAPEIAHWTWRAPQNNQMCGGLSALVAGDLPGVANLLWLVIGTERPDVYDPAANPLAAWVLTMGIASVGPDNAKAFGWPAQSLAGAAELLTLEQFAELPVLSGPGGTLVLLARRRAGLL